MYVYLGALTGPPALPGAASGARASLAVLLCMVTVRPLVIPSTAPHDGARPVLVIGKA